MKLKNSFNILLIFAIAIIFAWQPLSSLLTSQALNEGNAKIIVSKCDMFSEPDFSSERILPEDEHLKHNDIVVVISESGDFVKISFNERVGYVYKYYLTQFTDIEIYPVFNASLRRDSILYDIEQKEEISTIKKNTRVYLYNGFKGDEKGFCPVQVVLENGSLYNGYIKTSDINPDGVSGLLIAGISIIIASVTIILSLIFIKKRKKN